MIVASADMARLVAELRARAEGLALAQGKAMRLSPADRRWRSAAALWPSFAKE